MISKLAWGFLLSVVLESSWAEAVNEEEPVADLDSVSINELMQMEVSSVSRKSQQLSDTAAAAFIISQEDIRRSGATSIPEALRMAPGVEVAQIGAGRWALTIRGFNGQYANKLLVLMDGRTLYTPLFAGVFWDQQDTMMEDIERIEVIRGPGAVMWGSNAVNGVINIITKKAKDTQGNLAVVGGGNQEQGFAAYRHGGQLGNDGNYRVYAKAFEREAYVNTLGQRQYDDWRSAQSGFRVDQRLSNDQRLTVQGDVYRMKKGCRAQPLTVEGEFSDLFTRDCYGDGANLLSRWEANLSDGSELALQGYYDRVSFDAAALSNVQDTFDLDFQHRLHPNASHDLMWGLNYRFINSSTVNTDVFQFSSSDLGYHMGSAFVQDDISLIDNELRLTLGGKIEQSHFGDTQLQPNARLLWTPDERHSIWTSLSRASRIPSQGLAQADVAAGTTQANIPLPTPIGLRNFTVPVQLMVLANPDLKAEKVFSAEIGYRTQWTRSFSTDITAFSSHYTDQIVLGRGKPGIQRRPLPQLPIINQPLLWSNSAEQVDTRGIELSSDWHVLDWMRFSGSYTHLKIEDDSAKFSPRHHGSVRWQMDMTDKLQFDTTLRHVGKLGEGTGVQAYTTFDARLAYRPLKGMEWSVTAQNLFTPQHLEFNDSPVAASSAFSIAVPRSIYGKLSWEF